MKSASMTDKEKKLKAAREMARDLGLSMGGLATHLGISKQALYARLRSESMNVGDVLSPGPKATNPRFNGKETIRRACVRAGIPENTYWTRRKNGLAHEEALRARMARKRFMDVCIARGCGGLIRGVEAEEYDGAIRYCGSCKREHTFHTDGISWLWTIERKRYPRKPKTETGAQVG